MRQAGVWNCCEDELKKKKDTVWQQWTVPEHRTQQQCRDRPSLSLTPHTANHMLINELGHIPMLTARAVFCHSSFFHPQNEKIAATHIQAPHKSVNILNKDMFYLRCFFFIHPGVMSPILPWKVIANTQIVGISQRRWNYSLELMYGIPRSQHTEWFVFNHSDVLLECSAGWKLSSSTLVMSVKMGCHLFYPFF